MTLIEKLWNIQEDEFKEILEDMPFWIRLLLRVCYLKVQMMKQSISPLLSLQK